VNATQLRETLVQAMGSLEQYREELRALDAAIGDGDLGITVAGGAAAVAAALETQKPETISEVLREVARSFAKANPSTMSGLAAAALLAAARETGEAVDVDRDLATRILEVAEHTIRTRGGAEVGDKTVLDPIDASLVALRSAPDDPTASFAAMTAAAKRAIDETVNVRSRRGRAAWVGERSVGHADGGATAFLRLLECLAAAWPVTAVTD
jgi:dihydroxyacetone kinase-like protein